MDGARRARRGASFFMRAVMDSFRMELRRAMTATASIPMAAVMTARFSAAVMVWWLRGLKLVMMVTRSRPMRV